MLVDFNQHGGCTQDLERNVDNILKKKFELVYFISKWAVIANPVYTVLPTFVTIAFSFIFS